MPSDLDLLDRFRKKGAREAFAELVRRHAPFVMGVCARNLRNVHDAEDAFQATFLVLFRKAGSIRTSEALGSWLYGVAVRIALQIKSRKSVRKERPMVMEDVGTVAEEPKAWEEIRPILDEEIGRLPEKYRAALVLCCFEGKTNEQAARELGWPASTTWKRFVRARDLLRGRLARRGIVGVTGGVLLALLAKHAAAASVSGGLIAATIQSCALLAAGQPTLVSGSVMGLVEGGLKTMMWLKLKSAAAVMLAAGVAAGGGTWAAHRVFAEPAQEKSAALSQAEFEKLHAMIKPHPGESRWMEIEWFPNVWEARKKAAAEGKPIFLLAGSGGAPAAGC